MLRALKLLARICFETASCKRQSVVHEFNIRAQRTARVTGLGRLMATLTFNTMHMAKQATARGRMKTDRNECMGAELAFLRSAATFATASQPGSRKQEHLPKVIKRNLKSKPQIVYPEHETST